MHRCLLFEQNAQNAGSLARCGLWPKAGKSYAPQDVRITGIM